MSFCGNCGNEVPEGMKFCPNCGTAVVKIDTAGTLTDEESKSLHAINREWKPIPHQMSQRETRAMYINDVPKPTGIDRFGRYYGIVLMLLSIIGFLTDPPLVTILLSATILAGSIFCLSKKYKLKGFTIVALILSAICLLAGAFQANKFGILKMPPKSGTKTSEVTNENRPTISVENNTAPQKPSSRDETFGRITFSIPGYYMDIENNDPTEKVFETDDETALFIFSVLDQNVPRSSFANPEAKKLLGNEVKEWIGEGLGDLTEEKSVYDEVAGLQTMLMSYTSKENEADITCDVAYINDEADSKVIGILHMYYDEYADKYADDFKSALDSARLKSGDVSSSSSTDDTSDPSETSRSSGGVDPDLKAFLDSYESFVDEYVAFMKKYMADPTNAISMLGEYTEIMDRYSDFADKIDKYDSKTMSTEDAKYYLEVTTRCTQKMLDIY